MRKLKLTMPIMSALIAIVLAVGTSAFTPAHPVAPKGKATILVYYYLPNTLTGASTPGNWTPEDEVPAPPECDGAEVPCRLSFDTGDFANITAYMSGKSDLDVKNDRAHVINKDE